MHHTPKYHQASHIIFVSVFVFVFVFAQGEVDTHHMPKYQQASHIIFVSVFVSVFVFAQGEVEAHHMPKYQQASRMAPSSAPPGRGSQGCQQNLSSKFNLRGEQAFCQNKN